MYIVIILTIAVFCGIIYSVVTSINEEIAMGRPRVIKTKDGGEITLKNVAPELAEMIVGLVKTGTLSSASKPTEPAPTPATLAPAPTGTMLEKAIGICKTLDGTRFRFVEVNYNAETKQAQVSKVEECGTEKEAASERLKIAAVKLRLV